VAADAKTGWIIDRDIRFHYAYFDPDEAPGDGAFEYPPPATFSRPYLPDITNIMLKGLNDFEFPVPVAGNDDKRKFYLKFYRFPASLDPQVTMHRVLNDFLLFRMHGKEDIYSYVADRANVLIKKGFIAADTFKFSQAVAFPPLRVAAGGAKSPQMSFDKAIPFSSLYVKPAENPGRQLTRDQKAAWSTRGLVEFHRELQLVYQTNYTEVAGVEADKFRYFACTAYGGQQPVALTVIRMPRKPMIFGNYENLPMPHDPDRVFLTGLVLVHKYTYASKNPAEVISGAVKVGSEGFAADNAETSAHVLEIGSVVIFPR
jgi:hypothetical protein